MVFATSFFVAAVALASSALAHPHHGPHAKHLHKRAPIINQCNHGFSLTFDDGPYVHTSSMIDDIRNASGGQAKVTWYMNGKNFKCIYEKDMYDAVVKAYNNGHQIASHTWSHAELTKKTWAQIDEEVQRLDEAFVRIIGKKPRFLRPPYGAINQEIADYLATKHGKVTVTWDLDTRDTAGVNTANGVVDFYENLLNQAEAANVCPYPPHLTLSHDVQVWTAAATWESISMLYDGGYDLITTAQCLDQPAYVDVGAPQPYDSSWVNLCTGSWTPPATPTCLRTYTSGPGDNCENIGSKHGMTASEVLAANPFLSCGDIWANTPICITTPGNGGGSSSSSSTSSSATPGPSPPPCLRTYTAVQGDTCAKIGREFGMSEAEVKAANTFLDCSNIWAWTPICITTAGPGVSSSTTTTASSSSSSPPTQPVCVRRYTSKRGDTCEGIASAHKMTVNELKAANSFVNCADIWENTSFCITTAASTECVATYSSKPNDTCSSIESKFGLSANSIIANNAFLGCNDIWAFTPICIPPVTSSCKRSIVTSGPQTCASAATANGLDAAQIKAWNTFVGCDDIWSGTTLCVQH